MRTRERGNEGQKMRENDREYERIRETMRLIGET